MFHFNVLVVSWKGKTVTRKALHPRNDCRHWIVPAGSFLTAPSTKQTYALKWSLFATWCSSHREDPRRCTIGVVLSFLQERLEHRLSPSTLKVYVAAIAAHHNAVDGWSLGKHDLIVRFLKGARNLAGSSWLDFRGAPLSRWTQSSWSSCLLRQRSWPRSLPSNGSGTSRRFR